MFFPIFNDLSPTRLFAIEQAVSQLLATGERHFLQDVVGQHSLSHTLFEMIVQRSLVPPRSTDRATASDRGFESSLLSRSELIGDYLSILGDSEAGDPGAVVAIA